MNWKSVMSKNYLYWDVMPLFPLMSKDTRAGSRRTQPQSVAVRRVFRHKRGAQHLHKERATDSLLSDAPALIESPSEHVTWNKVSHHVR